ncbi:hypothetical protein F8171_04245 [Bacillus cereus]|nr:hypothetical protein F8171_04245 [Bacillus cereus]
MLLDVFIVVVYLLNILMCSFITLEYKQNELKKVSFLIWLVLVFITGPIAFFLYVLFKKRA